MFENITSGEGFTSEQKLIAYYAYSMGAMENAFSSAIGGIAELFSVWAMNESNSGSQETAGQLWNRFLLNPQIQDYINKAVFYGGIRRMA